MENIIKLKYNMEADKPEIQKQKRGKIDKIYRKIKKHTFITFIIGCFFLLSIFNVYLIYNFMNLLQDI